MVSICPVDCVECADRKVACIECKPTRHFKSLSAHVGQIHKMSLEDYRKKYTQDGTGEDVSVGWTVQSAAGAIRQHNAANAEINAGVKQYDPLALAQQYLSDTEKNYFAERHNLLFRQVDEDPALLSTVRDIVLGEIQLGRLQEQQARLTSMFSRQGFKSADAAKITAVNKLIKDIQETNLKLSNSLSITRSEKQKQKKVIESTPSRYVSAYERIRKNFSEDQLERANREEEEAVDRLRRKAKDFEPLAAESDRDSE